MSGGQHREPLPVAPFITWAEGRITRIRSDLGIDAPRGGSDNGADMNYVERFMAEIGWDSHNGPRKLHRWMHPEQGEGHSGIVERAEIEDALHCAGVLFSDIYPDAPARLVVMRLGQGARMTEAQIIAAHTVYMRGRLTIDAVAALIWERYGYANQEAGRCAIRRGWYHLDLPRRQCVESTRTGERCRKHPMSGSDLCPKHDKTITFGWQPPPDLIERCRDMYMGGFSFKAIGRVLILETPWTHHTYAAKRIADIAQEQGWHASSRGQRPPRQAVAA